MNINEIPVISVSYNSVELIEDLLKSFRTYYSNPITIIDGSSADKYQAIEKVCERYHDVKFIHFDYNIHHGPGMAWAFQNLPLSGPVLVLDSDVVVLKAGFLESMLTVLKPEMYGVGCIGSVDESGFDIEHSADAIRYLYPACMLCNIEVVRRWPMPTKHGAPMTEPMLAIHRAGKHELIADIQWLTADFSKNPSPNYLRHDWQGTVKRTGGYHLEEWERAAKEATNMRQLTLSLLPANAQSVVEIGAGDGGLARVLKSINGKCRYVGIEIDPIHASLEKGARDEVLAVEPNLLNSDRLKHYANADCWIFDKALERMPDANRLLTDLRKVIRQHSSVVAVIPNAQHWTVQAKLSIGDFRYQNDGLVNIHHLRWFTRATILELFRNAGFSVVQGYPVINNPIKNEILINAIKQFALAVDANPEVALEDSQPEYYIVKANPI